VNMRNAESMFEVSIVTPSLNQGKFIGEAIQSVVNQRTTNVEHWIVDGGSRDQTLEVLMQRARDTDRVCLKWKSGPDSGQSDALNYGFRQATGDVVGWLNSDDRYRPGCFKHVQRSFVENPDVDVIYGDYTIMDEDGKSYKTRREIEFNPFILKYHRIFYIATAATFFRRRIFDEGNWLDDNLHYAMDLDLFVRLASAGYRIKHIPVVLADVRLHRECKSWVSANEMQKERNALMRRYSRLSRKSWPPAIENAAYAGAKVIAGLMRYTEKAIRGYYFR
jgi:glycosyltransferase involved in cell wall biosynthesis